MNRIFSRITGWMGGPALANTGWLYLDQVIRAVVVLVAFGAVARHLGPEQFGRLSYAVAFAGVFLPLAVIGLDYVVVMELVRNRSAEKIILATVGRMKVVAALAGVLLACLMAVPTMREMRPLLLVVAFSLLGQPFMVLDHWFQSHMASRHSVLARLGSCLVANGLRVWFVLLHAPLAWFVWLFVAEAWLYGLGLVLAFSRARGPRLSEWWRSYDATVARRLWRQAWPLFLADLAIMGYLRIDQLVLSHLAGESQLGRYAAAFRLADAVEFFALALINSWFPRLVALHGRSRAEFDAGLSKFLTGLTLFSVLCALLLSATAPWVARWVLGPDFAGAEKTLMILAWANVLVTLIAVRGKWFLLDGLQHYSLAIFAIGAVAHLAGVWLLAADWGSNGAAVSFLFAHGVMVWVAPLLFPRTRAAVFLTLRAFWPRRN